MYALEASRLSTSPEETGGGVPSVFASWVEDEPGNRKRHQSNTQHGSHHWTRHAAIMALPCTSRLRVGQRAGMSHERGRHSRVPGSPERVVVGWHTVAD